MALGVKVTLVDGRDKLLPFLDSEISDRLRDRLKELGMEFWFNERPVKVENSASGATLHMKSGKKLETEAALFAAGRRAAVDGLALEKAGLALNDRGYIPVDENYRTGVTEDSCKEKKIGYCVGRARYENNARGHITGDTAGLLKIVFSPADKKLLGVSIIGENATELIHIGMMALDNGLTINEFIEQVFNYPTLSEMYKYAAYDGLGNLAGHK